MKKMIERYTGVALQGCPRRPQRNSQLPRQCVKGQMQRNCSMILLAVSAIAAVVILAGCGQQLAALNSPKPSSTAQGSAAQPAAGSSTAGTKNEILLGAVFPVTGIGANAGKREHVGATLAVDELNTAGGINGAKVRLVFMDTGGNPQEAVNAVKKLASDEKVLAIIGPHYSSEAEVTFPVGNQLKIVQIAVAASKVGLAAANRPFAFRNMIIEDTVFARVAARLVGRGIRNAAIITDIKDAIAKSLGTQVFPEGLKKVGIEVLNEDNPATFQTGDSDFSAQVTRVKALKPDAVLLGALGPDALSIIIEGRRQGVTVPFVGGQPIHEGELDKKGGRDTEGTIAGAVYWVGDPSEKNKRFISAYEKRVRQMYPGFTTEPLHYSANAYDAVYMVGEAITKGGVTNRPEDLPMDRERIRAYLAGMKDFDGVNSKGFDQDGDGIKPIYVLEIKDGKWIEAK